MDVQEAIHRRRTVGSFKPDLPDPALIEELLEAATWAPNHRVNEPWRFFVLAGEAREAFGQVLAENALLGMPHLGPAEQEAVARAMRDKALRSPVVIAVASEPPAGPRIEDIENVAAVSAGIQNMLLTAQARGLGVKWSTDGARSAHVKRFFGLTPQHHILAFLYVGYPAREPGEQRRTPHQEKAEWRGWPVGAATTAPVTSGA